MQVQHYADEYRRYSSFCRNYSGNKLYKVACGSDEKWNEQLLTNLKSDIAPDLAKAITLHYYTIIGETFEHKGSATNFTEDEYYWCLRNTQCVDDIIDRHSKIMDIQDPDKKIGLIVDEWGCWFDVEPGTNPSFLYQQNTMRDAIIAAIYLNIFNAHSNRVVMANLAQAVNVLQSIILTDGEYMIKTPTYHVMDMFKEHMDSTLLYSTIENEVENEATCLSQSVSIEDEGKIHITIANTSLHKDFKVECTIPYANINLASARILTGDVRAHNTFDNPDNVKIADYNVRIIDSGIEFNMPQCSIVAIEIIMV